MAIWNSANSHFLKVNIRNTRIANMFKINNKDTRTTQRMLFLCLYCQFWQYLTPSSYVPISLGTKEADSRLREQRDFYSCHNFEYISNHISNRVFLLLTLSDICLLGLSVLYFNRFQIKMNSAFIHLQKGFWQIEYFHEMEWTTPSQSF